MLFTDAYQCLLGNWSYSKQASITNTILNCNLELLFQRMSYWIQISVLKNAPDSVIVFTTCGTVAFPVEEHQVMFCFCPQNLANYSETLLKTHFSRMTFFLTVILKESTLSSSWESTSLCSECD